MIEVIEPSIQTVEVGESSHKAFEVMNDLLGADNVSAVMGVSQEFSKTIAEVTPQQWESVGVAGLVGGGIGFAFGILLTNMINKMEEKYSGHKPVPALGTGCAVIPVTTFVGGIIGMGGKLLLVINGFPT